MSFVSFAKRNIQSLIGAHLETGSKSMKVPSPTALLLLISMRKGILMLVPIIKVEFYFCKPKLVLLAYSENKVVQKLVSHLFEDIVKVR
mmetsp:Transcript_3405/g.3365  ORF Transcript_3405/g.3365 Transcript_3405/m.3365 type:complete len:89 (+) Transcript_3405:610-876(+)